ncbi:IS3 family transposase, partial [Nocardia farcinica]|nr:IS3 family transposase [Nocardia farcinica]
GVYGVRKVHASLKRKGMSVARCTVERLMKADGLQGIPRLKSRRVIVKSCGLGVVRRPRTLGCRAKVPG